MKVFNLKKRSAGNENGFTMIEILIAISIFAIGMLAVASMQISGIHGNATANTVTNASAWAADRVETLLGLDYDNPFFNNDPAAEPAGTDYSAGTLGGRYTIGWNVQTGAVLPNTKTITVSVSYTNRGKPKAYSFVYYKADI